MTRRGFFGLLLLPFFRGKVVASSTRLAYYGGKVEVQTGCECFSLDVRSAYPDINQAYPWAMTRRTP